MGLVITLTTAGTDIGPFNLYSDIDDFTGAFESNISRTELIEGFPTLNVPAGTTIIRVQSLGPLCNNSVDVVIAVVEAPPGVVTPALRPKIGNPVITVNNKCETVFEGNYRIPEGTVATVVGTVVQNFLGGGNTGMNGVGTFVGTVNNKPPGGYPFTVDLGNSGLSGVSSTYTLSITLSNGESVTKTFKRTIAESPYYDTNPC